jgi:hypothetical protein
MLHSFLVRGELTNVAVAIMGPSVAVWVGLRALLGLYPGNGLDSAEKLRRHTYSVFATLAIIAVMALGFHIGILLSRLLLALTFSGLLFAGPLVHHLCKKWLRAIGLWGKPVVILSYTEAGNQFVDLMRREWGLGYKPLALFDYNLLPAGRSFAETYCQETLDDAQGFARTRGINTLVFAMPYTRREQLVQMVDWASERFRYVLIMPNLAGITNSGVRSRDFAGTFMVEIRHNLLDPWVRAFKRLLDSLVTVLGGLLIGLLLLLIALMIKLDSKGPAFYGHRRLGAGGRHFICWKFRTMHGDADRMLDEYLHKHPERRQEGERSYKLRDDPRVTRVGRFLRKSSLDELPQLWTGKGMPCESI